MSPLRLPWTAPGHVLAALLGLHALVLLGLLRDLPPGERLAQYPALLLGAFSPRVWPLLAPQAALSAAYLLGGLALAWPLSALLARWNRGLLQVLGGVPPYLLLAGAVWGGLIWTQARGQDFPLSGWAPLMLGLFVGALALPAAARTALLTRQVRAQALRADHSRAARAMGLSETRVRRRAARLARPGRASALAGEALGLAFSLSVMEGLLQFPGVGGTVFAALQSVLGGLPASGAAWADPLLPRQLLSGSLLALLALALLASALLRAVAARLDPRPLAGAEAG